MRRVTPEDYPEIQAWCLSRGLPFDSAYFSSIGWIEPGVCACWVYKTETPVAYLDFFISNPEASTSQVFEAGRQIFVNACKTPGITHLIGYSTSPLLCGILNSIPVPVLAGTYFNLEVEKCPGL